MKLLVIGSREDVAGFALAGVDGVVCATREDAEQVLARADEDTLVIRSPGFGPGDQQAIRDANAR